MKKHIPYLLIVIALTLTACEPDQPVPKYATDQAKYAERFDSCMRLLPAGPQSTKYNDWDEVVKGCNYVAYAQSRVCVQNYPKMPE